ncbi:MAG: hypothetical protein KTR30_39035 [Saprospiraceae bacterium]|nr:hypothetical protein [Saprospiraceae bacterium]
MSTLYKATIKKLEVSTKPIEYIVDLAYHASQDNFRHRLGNCGLDLSQEPSKIRTARLVELLHEIKVTQGVEALKALSLFNWDQTNEAWTRLSASYQTNLDLLHAYQSIVRNNLFYQVLGETEKILPVLMIDLEILSVHPDAGYPRYRRNPATTKEDERRFLLRILADSIGDVEPGNPLTRESEKPTQWNNTQTGTDYRMDASKIIWGFERHKGLKIKPISSKAFWKRNHDQWWYDLKDSYFEEKSDNKPFELVPYHVMVHPGWEKTLSKVLGKRIESTAYWS